MKQLVPVGFLLVLALAPGAGSAQEVTVGTGGFPGDVPETLRIWVGALYAAFDTSFSYNPSSSGLGVALNYEAFGLPESGFETTAGGRWRVSRRGSVYFGYHGSSRDGNVVLEQDVEVADYTLLAGSRLAMDFEGSFLRAGYRYDVYDNGEVRIAGSAGLSWVELDTSLLVQGEVLDPQGDPVGGEYRESFSIEAPAPQVGFTIDWAFARRGVVTLYLRTLYVDLGDVRGNFTDAGVAVVWYPWRQAGVGLGVERTDIALREYKGDDFYARGGYGQTGLQLFLELAF